MAAIPSTGFFKKPEMSKGSFRFTRLLSCLKRASYHPTAIMVCRPADPCRAALSTADARFFDNFPKRWRPGKADRSYSTVKIIAEAIFYNRLMESAS